MLKFTIFSPKHDIIKALCPHKKGSPVLSTSVKMGQALTLAF